MVDDGGTVSRPVIHRLAARFSGLVRSLNMSEEGAPLDDDAQQQQQQLARSLPAVDSVFIAIALSKLSPIACAPRSQHIWSRAAADTWHEQTLVERCLAAPEFGELTHKLQCELQECVGGGGNESSWLDELSKAVQGDPAPSSSDDEEDGSGAGDRDHALDMLLHDELNADLPPFYELLAVISAATNEARAPEGVLPAWRKLHAFSPSDLLECEQWPDLPSALYSLILSSNLDASSVAEVAALQHAIFDDGVPVQLAAMALNVCAALKAADSGGSEGRSVGPSAQLLLLQLAFSALSARLELCNCGMQMDEQAFEALLAELIATSCTIVGNGTSFATFQFTPSLLPSMSSSPPSPPPLSPFPCPPSVPPRSPPPHSLSQPPPLSTACSAPLRLRLYHLRGRPCRRPRRRHRRLRLRSHSSICVVACGRPLSCDVACA